MTIHVLLIESTLYLTIAKLHPAVSLESLLPSFVESEGTRYLFAIDQYADTFFNDLQIDGFLREWRTLYSDQLTDEETATLQAVEALALRAKDEHLTLSSRAIESLSRSVNPTQPLQLRQAVVQPRPTSGNAEDLSPHQVASASSASLR